MSTFEVLATDCYIVHEIYSRENAQDQFEYELEALDEYTVMEPTRPGHDTARRITVGNCLHKKDVLAGAACLFTALAQPLDSSRYISLPAGVLRLACWTLHRRQLDPDAYELSVRLPLHTLTSSAPVVRVRKGDLRGKRPRNAKALAALVRWVKLYELHAV
ncbi:transmembrane protein 11, mitochondrial-like [Psammomys obesus]|uniref:transmembrane protein 11, mitochondrial-like n=1 Tax=Psammomys obesus TaxID=48139 RepID=UPI0024528E7E|nr:transmembrane protein 11, mitochondrial-like [Psammomys obesus]